MVSFVQLDTSQRETKSKAERVRNGVDYRSTIFTPVAEMNAKISGRVLKGGEQSFGRITQQLHREIARVRVESGFPS